MLKGNLGLGKVADIIELGPADPEKRPEGTDLDLEIETFPAGGLDDLLETGPVSDEVLEVIRPDEGVDVSARPAGEVLAEGGLGTDGGKDGFEGLGMAHGFDGGFPKGFVGICSGSGSRGMALRAAAGERVFARKI